MADTEHSQGEAGGENPFSPAGWSAVELAEGAPISDEMIADLLKHPEDLPRMGAAYIFSHTGLRLIGRVDLPTEDDSFAARFIALHHQLRMSHEGYNLHDLPYVDEYTGFTYGVFRDEEGDHFGRVTFNPIERKKWLTINHGAFYELNEI